MMRLFFIIAVLSSTLSAYLLILKAICFFIGASWAWLDFYNVAYLSLAVVLGYALRLFIERRVPTIWENEDSQCERFPPLEETAFAANDEIRR